MSSTRFRVSVLGRWWFSVAVGLWVIAIFASVVHVGAGAPLQTSAFQPIVLRPSLPEAPFPLRFFAGAVKTDSRGEIITGYHDDPVKRLVGAEAAGERAGVERFTKIMFGVNYFDGRPDPGHAHRSEQSAGQQRQPALAVRAAAVPQLAERAGPDARRREALRHAAGPRRLSGLARRRRSTPRRAACCDGSTCGVAGQPRGTRPVGIAVSPLNTAIYAAPVRSSS